MSLMNNIIHNLQYLDKELEQLLAHRDYLVAEAKNLKAENEDLKQRIKIIHTEMELYMKELKEIREYYVSSNNNAQ